MPNSWKTNMCLYHRFSPNNINLAAGNLPLAQAIFKPSVTQPASGENNKNYEISWCQWVWMDNSTEWTLFSLITIHRSDFTDHNNFNPLNPRLIQHYAYYLLHLPCYKLMRPLTMHVWLNSQDSLSQISRNVFFWGVFATKCTCPAQVIE